MVVAPWVKVKTERGKKACIFACGKHINIDSINYDDMAAAFPGVTFNPDNIEELQNKYLEGLNQDQTGGTKTESKKIAATKTKKSESKTGTKTGSAEKPGIKKRGRPTAASKGELTYYQKKLRDRKIKNGSSFPPDIIEKYTPDSIENNHDILMDAYKTTIYNVLDSFLAENPDIKKEPQKYWVNKFYVRVKTSIPKIDLHDIDLIDFVYDIYSNICFNLGILPSINGFCIFSGVEYYIIKDWVNNKQGLNPKYAAFLKKALNQTENNLVNKLMQHDGANTNVMFLLNTCYGYDKKTVVSHVSSAETAKKLDDIPVFEIESND